MNARKIESEYLSKDILEEVFLDSFSHFHILQTILGISHVDARDRFVTAPTTFQKFYTIAQTTAAIILNVVSFCMFIIVLYPYPQMVSLAATSTGVNIVSYVLIVINSRFVNAHGNVKLYTEMQKIDRLMRIEHNHYIYNMMRWVHSITLFIILGTALVTFVGALCNSITMAISCVGVLWPLYSCIAEMSYGSNLIMYFFIRIRFINSILINFIEGKSVINKPKYLRGPSEIVMRYLAAQTHDFQTSEADVLLKKILESFDIFQEIYRLPVGIFISGIFIHSLVTCQSMIFIASLDKSTNTGEIVGGIAQLITAFLQMCFLCLRCEAFLRALKETKRHAVVILSLNVEDSLRGKAKRMLRMLDQLPPRFSVFDMWNVSAQFLINFLKIISSLLFTILQLNM